jgi:hypothetical protein
MKLLFENTAKQLISEGLEWHIDTNTPLTENVFRPGSREYFKLFNEARKLYNRGLLETNHSGDTWFLESDLGKIGIYNNKKVPLDYPMILKEGEYQGKKVDLNSPMRSSGPTKYKVYVKNSKGNVVKVNFGDVSGGLKSKISDPKARKAFADRHNCSEKKDKTKAGYWSCNLPRYAKQLGLSSGGNYYW